MRKRASRVSPELEVGLHLALEDTVVPAGHATVVGGKVGGDDFDSSPSLLESGTPSDAAQDRNGGEDDSRVGEDGHQIAGVALPPLHESSDEMLLHPSNAIRASFKFA